MTGPARRASVGNAAPFETARQARTRQLRASAPRDHAAPPLAGTGRPCPDRPGAAAAASGSIRRRSSASPSPGRRRRSGGPDPPARLLGPPGPDLAAELLRLARIMARRAPPPGPCSRRCLIGRRGCSLTPRPEPARRFPVEAGLIPGFRPLEGEERGPFDPRRSAGAPNGRRSRPATSRRSACAWARLRRALPPVSARVPRRWPCWAARGRRGAAQAAFGLPWATSRRLAGQCADDTFDLATVARWPPPIAHGAATGLAACDAIAAAGARRRGSRGLSRSGGVVLTRRASARPGQLNADPFESTPLAFADCSRLLAMLVRPSWSRRWRRAARGTGFARAYAAAKRGPAWSISTI